MKKIIATIIYVISCIVSAQAQTLYCTTPKGGSDGGGTINKFIPATNNLIVAKSFERSASLPSENFIQASDGKLYGMTSEGGSSSDNGVIFSFDPSSATYTNVKLFIGTDGANPHGSLIQASDGKLYGMTYHGGSNKLGVIFSFDPASSNYTKLKDFDSTDGANPGGSLMQASDGKLYGTTAFGGSSNAGVIFSFDPTSSAYTKLTDFDYTNGAFPFSLMQASDGQLYGTTVYGGSRDAGVIFSFDPTSSTYTKLKDFDYTNGAFPNGSLIQASDRKLYGITDGGGSSDIGIIFSFDPSSSTYTKLKDFDNTSGTYPSGSLMQASDGKLYGMTIGGGSSNLGVIFSFDPSSSTYTKLKEFDDTSGSYPHSGLIQASDGKLYGMTYFGGSNNAGVIFSFDPSSSTYTKLLDFGTAKSGSATSASLIQANDGMLYGMTPEGGSNNAGVIFSFNPSSSTYTKLKDFNSTSGYVPTGSLMQASNGKLYGMTLGGGSSSKGVIFSFDPSYSTFTKLKEFDDISGSYTYGSLMQASDGKLYGMTYFGGSNNAGVIFSFDPTSATYAKLKEFDGTNGGNPLGSLIQASDGELYGMTYQGGSSNKGVLFSYDPSSSTYTKLKDFIGTDGAGPSGSLIQASDGKLYGMTYGGGSSDEGVIFSFDPSSSTYAKMKDFIGTDGANPGGNLMQASDGKLYGMTSKGGSKGFGVIFSFDPSSSTYTMLKDYNGANGANPGDGSAFIEVKDNQNTRPTVSLTAPADNATYLAPAAHIKLSAAASDSDGTVTKVEFYNGTALLDSVTVAPYDFTWRDVPLGEYTLTAKAYDNSGIVTTSDAVHISVVLNKPPTVSIIAPLNNEHYAAPAYIHFDAAASDTDGRITRVEFYNGSTLIRTEYKYPYTYVWRNIPEGTYTITAVATDNWGAQTTSQSITIKVKSENRAIVSSKPSVNNKTDLNTSTSLKLHPNPANKTLNIYTNGLQPNKPAIVSIISASGIVLKKMQMNSLSQSIQLDVSAIAKGVYTIKIISGEKVLYKQFVKL